MKWLGCLIGLGLVAGALSESAGCGEAFSAATGTGGASGSSGHTGGASSSSSSGVAQCAAASCSLGTYCNPETSACESCVTSTRFHFGPPVVQAVTLPTAGASALYPRFMAPSTSEVFLVQVDGAHLHQIAEASYAAGTSLPWGPAALLVQLAGTHQDTGPLYLDESSILAKWVSDSVTNPSMPVLLFDSDRIAGDTQVFAVTLGGTAIDPVVVSLPGNAAHNSSIAVSMSASPVRFWWISDASTVLGDAGAPQLPRLVTATTMDTAPADVVLMLDEGCPAPLATAPWVTPLGDRLLFA